MPARATIARALFAIRNEPPDLNRRRRREYCCVGAAVAEALGVPLTATERERVQVRIGVTHEDVARAPNLASQLGESACFTVQAVLHEACDRDRIGLYDGQDGGVGRLLDESALPPGARVSAWDRAPSVTRIRSSDTSRQALREVRHFVEPSGDPSRSFQEVVENGSERRIWLLAPHGGQIEIGTESTICQVRDGLRALGLRPAVWICQGSWGGHATYRRWHLSSVELGPRGFPGLGELIHGPNSFEHALSVHGFLWDERFADTGTYKYGLIIGGRAALRTKRVIQSSVEQALADAGHGGVVAYCIVRHSEDYEFSPGRGDLSGFERLHLLAGVSERNLVNRTAAQGVQVEMSLGLVLSPLREMVAAGLVASYRQLLGLERAAPRQGLR